MQKQIAAAEYHMNKRCCENIQITQSILDHVCGHEDPDVRVLYCLLFFITGICVSRKLSS